MSSLMKPLVIVSRTDRIGDLVLSLPVLGYLKEAGFGARVLHVSPYCRDVAEWARLNNLCEAVWLSGEEAPEILSPKVYWPSKASFSAISLVYSPDAAREINRLRPHIHMGPRTKLAALFRFSHSVAQHRSQVRMSEMQYNIALAAEFIRRHQLHIPRFTGLPPLKVLPKNTAPMASPDVVVVVSNRGSAENWPIERYIDLAFKERAMGREIHFLVSGLDAVARRHALLAAGVEAQGCRIVEAFSEVGQLISYLGQARKVISSSTGPLHIAFAAGVEVLGIYPTLRRQSFERWKPDGYWHGAPLRLLEIGENSATF